MKISRKSRRAMEKGTVMEPLDVEVVLLDIGKRPPLPTRLSPPPRLAPPSMSSHS